MYGYNISITSWELSRDVISKSLNSITLECPKFYDRERIATFDSVFRGLTCLHFRTYLYAPLDSTSANDILARCSNLTSLFLFHDRTDAIDLRVLQNMKQLRSLIIFTHGLPSDFNGLSVEDAEIISSVAPNLETLAFETSRQSPRIHFEFLGRKLQSIQKLILLEKFEKSFDSNLFLISLSDPLIFPCLRLIQIGRCQRGDLCSSARSLPSPDPQPVDYRRKCMVSYFNFCYMLFHKQCDCGNVLISY